MRLVQARSLLSLHDLHTVQGLQLAMFLFMLFFFGDHFVVKLVQVTEGPHSRLNLDSLWQESGLSGFWVVK